MSDSLVPQLPVSEKPRALAIEPAVVLVPPGLFMAVIAVAAPDGSYFPSSWGWASLAFLWAAAIGLVVQKRVTLGPPRSRVSRRWLVLLVWTAASVLWSPTTTQTMYEVERTSSTPRSRSPSPSSHGGASTFLLPALLAGIVAVASYALATRLLPDRVGTFDSFVGYRLSEPLGYWNALSVFVAIGIVVAVGLAARAEAVVVRALSAASLVLLVPVLYFTFGRGGWIALASGLAAAIVVDPRRLQLVTTLLVIAPWPALAIWQAYESPSLTTQFSRSQDASRGGQPTGLDDRRPRRRLGRRHDGLTRSLHDRVTVGRGVRARTARCSFSPSSAASQPCGGLRGPVRVGPPCARLDQAVLAERQRRSDEAPVQPLLQWPARKRGSPLSTTRRHTLSSARARVRSSGGGSRTGRSASRSATPTASTSRRSPSWDPSAWRCWR